MKHFKHGYFKHRVLGCCLLLLVNVMSVTANLRTNIVDFKGFDSSIMLNLRGGIPRPTGDFPGKLESSNLDRDHLSREIQRKSALHTGGRSRGGHSQSAVFGAFWLQRLVARKWEKHSFAITTCTTTT